jgi:outer membrane receptor protein involved in Fe transport
MKIIGISFIFILLNLSAYAKTLPEVAGNPDNTTPSAPGKITGKVIEEGSNVPLEYATIAVYSQSDSSLASGAITDQKGQFSIDALEPGRYYVDVRYMGYENFRRANIVINQNISTIDLGILELEPATENISEVTVTSQSKAIAYSLDRKVIDPSFFPADANGTAVDILANAPSVTVDIEGNVALRGSSGFTVLIDGRPTPFDAADALRQIPASTIRNIEIITNPSAKYDPDGNAGIININTKKSRLQGFSGLANFSGDTQGSMAGDLLLNYRYRKFNFFVSGNLGKRLGSGTSESLTSTTDSITSFTESSGERSRGSISNSLKAGFDYEINDNNTLTLNVDVNSRMSEEESSLIFEESNSAGYFLKSLSNSSGSRGGDELALSLNYTKKFAREEQVLTAFFQYETGNGEELSSFYQYDTDNVFIYGLNGWEVGESEKDFRATFDYVHPLSGNKKFETGFQSRIDRSKEWNDVHWFTSENDTYEPSPSSPYYTNTDLSQDIHSVYGIFSNSNSFLGYQLGLRTEYTNRILSYSGSSEKSIFNRFDYFPSMHFSFELPKEQQMIVSYSRRIDRPRGYYLEPFITYEDAYNVRKGNPGILPEYIDSYELGYQAELKKEGFISAEAYFRQTNNKIERVQTVYEPNVLMRSVANVGTDYSLGVELMLNLQPLKWWTLNLMGNLYNYRLEGEFEEREFSTQSNNWNSRFNNTFLLGKNTRFQLNATYYSPTVNAQGRREGFLFTNAAIRQDFFQSRLSATLGVRDILNTARFEFTSEGYNFSSYRKYEMQSPVVSFTLSYRLNNFRQQERGGGMGEGGMEMDGGGEI